MPELAFFYGTLMTPSNRMGRLRVDQYLVYAGRGTIAAALFDIGLYPAAVPASDGRVRGEVYEVTHPAIVLQALDQLKRFRAALSTPGRISTTRRSDALSASNQAITSNT